MSLNRNVSFNPAELYIPVYFPISVNFLLISSMRNVRLLLLLSESSVIVLSDYIVTVLSSVGMFSVYVCVYVYVYVSMCVYVCVYVYMYVCMYVCVSMYMCM